MVDQNELTVVDLFCGAGGLSYGFLHAGYKIIASVDNSSSALQTYQANLGTHTHHADLSQNIDLPKPTVIIGGPPCQGFSSAGSRRTNDLRNSLVLQFAEIVAAIRPVAFVFENVEGFLTAEDGSRIIELLTPLINVGYRIHLRKINAANYGVPQHRKRVIAIGGLGWNPTFPQPTNTAYGAPGARLATTELAPTPTVGETFRGLPLPVNDAPGSPQGHYFRHLTDVELARITGLKQGQTMRDLPHELQHESYHRRAFRRVMDGTPTERRGGAPAGIRRLRFDEPSKAITGAAIAELIHPIEDRPLTIRECARLQTFPDDFIFYGSKSEQIQLIGNAVPPHLASIIANTLKDDLKTSPQLVEGGALLSFVPTLSEGFSPVLKIVSSVIEEKFMQPISAKQLPLWH